VPNKRPSIGLLFDFLYDKYQLKIWEGVTKTAYDLDLNLYCFPGGELEDPSGNSVQRNIVFDLVLPSRLDGVIIMSAVIANFICIKKFDEFYKRFKVIPNLSIGIDIQGSPSLLFDNTKGITDMVTHFVEEHNFKRIAYIKGPPENIEAK